ncbi:CapA family protein [Acrocarpospora catenulata]|uniref:CapA family protein n=1 Tax=Acrocarpospora catenulata TaxID=2836182 RepID=UPI001BDAB1B1|nr:CapA family protein [Acrocarpospora catenulata]
MSITLALAGDTMLGRGVADKLDRTAKPEAFFSAEVRDRLAEADLFLLNLECCVSDRGTPWPGRRFHFRAPPQAADLLAALGVGCVTLANNHALDYGHDALRDTRRHLLQAGIGCVGAGEHLAEARRPVEVEVRGLRIAIVAFADHPEDFAATASQAGIAYADLAAGTPSWLTETIASLRDRAEVVLVTPHWGPNMVTEPLPYIRTTANALLKSGATLVAGHSAHVFHGVEPPVLYDLGDFLDDYLTDRLTRNDLGLLWLVTLDAHGPVRLRALPLALGYARTRAAAGDDWQWIRDRFISACADLGTSAHVADQDLVVEFRTRP